MQNHALHTSHTPHTTQKITLRSFNGEQATQKEVEQTASKKVYTVPTSVMPLDTLSPTAKCIFIIDNSVSVCNFAETSLREAGYNAWSFQSGLDAMHWLATPGGRRPDLLFIDNSLPGIDSCYKVVHAFKSNPGLAQTVCILLSQSEDTIDRFKAKLAGIQSYMAKPFTAPVLLRVTRISLASVALAQPVL